ncbi:MAG TPA: flagellar biosynthesis anti-sigma factor FlgM [Tepidimicrobium sp.]|nr:flagellar biosynthesis anti-sigma factor FlgM [Tepidimicrobium sp.]
MKVDKTNRVLEIYNNMGFNRLERGRGRSERDSIKLSEAAQDYQFALKKLEEVPDIRMDKVEKLKEQVEAGTYNVEGKKIVEKMYQRINFDEKV